MFVGELVVYMFQMVFLARKGLVLPYEGLFSVLEFPALASQMVILVLEMTFYIPEVAVLALEDLVFVLELDFKTLILVRHFAENKVIMAGE